MTEFLQNVAVTQNKVSVLKFTFKKSVTLKMAEGSMR